MKKLIVALLFVVSGAAFSQTFPVNNLLVTGSLTATGLVTTADLAMQAANTVLLNGGVAAASPTAYAMPACNTSGNALQWTAGTGFTCGSVTLSGAITQAATGAFFASAGARINRMNDRLFLGTSTQYDGNQTPSTGDWSLTTFPVFGGPQGAYQYLVSGAMLPVGAIGGNLGVTAYGRTSDGGGSGTQATIGLSSFVVNDNTIGAGAASWALYGTTVRTATATGSNTNAVELDVANLGSTVQQFPNAMYPNGLTDGIGVNAGGELQNDSAVTMGVNSAGITISQNDVTGHAHWDKGIIFQSTAIAGCNGVTGTCPAIAMAPGHEITYYNNSNAVTGGFYSSATTVGGTTANEQFVQLSNFGTLFTDGVGNTQFQVNNTIANAVDHIVVTGAATGGAPVLSTSGSDTNIPLIIKAQGNSPVFMEAPMVLGNFTVGTLPACNAGTRYAIAAVSDATSPTYNSGLTGGGTVTIPVFCNGASWTAH